MILATRLISKAAFALPLLFFGAIAASDPLSLAIHLSETEQPPLTTDRTKTASSYGFVSKLPKDVEGFSATYRWQDSWNAFTKSQWVNHFLSLDIVKNHPLFLKASAQWMSPEGVRIRGVAESILGKEIIFVLPKGFAKPFKTCVELAKELEILTLSIDLTKKCDPNSAADESSMQAFQAAHPQFISALKNLELPPLLMISKAIQSKADLEVEIKNLVIKLEKSLAKTFVKGSFDVAGIYKFNSIRVNTKDLLKHSKFFQEFTTCTSLQTIDIHKDVELAWGWIDDYLVLSLGQDSKSIQLAENLNGSVFSIPEIALRAAQFLEKNPTDFCYLSQKFYEDFEHESFNLQARKYAAILKPWMHLKPEQIQQLHTLTQKLEDKYNLLFPSKYTPFVSFGYFENGMHLEIFGGSSSPMLDGSQPLKFTNVKFSSAFIALNWRQSKAAEKMADFMQEAAVSLWEWFEKNEKAIVPRAESSEFLLFKTKILPQLKNLWATVRKLDSALGSEKALVIALDGQLNDVYGVPPLLTNAKIPRLTFVSDLKNRKGISEAWETLEISQLLRQFPSPLVGNLIPLLSPQMNMKGEVELYTFPFLEFKDVAPHTGMTQDLWWIGTSPRLSEEIAMESSADKRQALAMEVKINFTPLWDYLYGWLKIADQHSNSIFNAHQAKEFQKIRPAIESLFDLARHILSIETTCSDEMGQTRSSIYLKYREMQKQE